MGWIIGIIIFLLLFWKKAAPGGATQSGPAASSGDSFCGGVGTISPGVGEPQSSGTGIVQSGGHVNCLTLPVTVPPPFSFKRPTPPIIVRRPPIYQTPISFYQKPYIGTKDRGVISLSARRRSWRPVNSWCAGTIYPGIGEPSIGVPRR